VLRGVWCVRTDVEGVVDGGGERAPLPCALLGGEEVGNGVDLEARRVEGRHAPVVEAVEARVVELLANELQMGTRGPQPRLRPPAAGLLSRRGPSSMRLGVRSAHVPLAGGRRRHLGLRMRASLRADGVAVAVGR
jgi:hypothetical protein